MPPRTATYKRIFTRIQMMTSFPVCIQVSSLLVLFLHSPAGFMLRHSGISAVGPSVQRASTIPARASGLLVRHGTTAIKARRKGRIGPIYRVKQIPKLSPEETIRVLARRMAKAERDERVDLTIALTQPKQCVSSVTFRSVPHTCPHPHLARA